MDTVSTIPKSNFIQLGGRAYLIILPDLIVAAICSGELATTSAPTANSFSFASDWISARTICRFSRRTMIADGLRDQTRNQEY